MEIIRTCGGEEALDGAAPSASVVKPTAAPKTRQLPMAGGIYQTPVATGSYNLAVRWQVNRRCRAGASSNVGSSRRSALVVLVLIVRFAAGLDWRLLALRMRAAEPSLVAVTALLLFARLLTWHFRWSATLNHAGDSTPAARRLAILLASVMSNHVLPSMRLAGGLVRARYIARGTLGFGQAYATALFDTTMHHATSGVFTWLTLVGATWVLGYELPALGVLAGGTVVLLYVAGRLRRDDPLDGVVARYLRRLQQPGGRLGSLVNRGRGLVEMVRRLAGRRALWWQLPVYSILWMVISVGAQWTLFIALGVDVDFWVAAAAIGLGVLATALTQTPGGIGSTEAAMVAAYAAFGIEQVDAVAGTLLYRGLHYVLVLALGLPSLLWCEMGSRHDASLER